MFLLQGIILQYRFGITNEEIVVATELRNALQCVEHCLSHRIEVFVANVEDAK